MEKDRFQNHNRNLLPPSGRNSCFPLNGNKENARPESSGSNILPTNGFRQTAESGHFSHDISSMPDNPPKYSGHRRARSEIVVFPDDISFDSDLGFVGGFDGPSYSEETEDDLFSMYLDTNNKLSSSSLKSDSQVVESSSSLEVQTSKTTTITPPVSPPPENHVHISDEGHRVKHQHSMSMDGSTTFNSEETSSTDAKKSISAAKLALVDPKRTKRIWANRQSAARSKERKMRYIGELETKVQTLQTEATSLSTQLTLLQRDVHGLTAENNELKLRLQSMEQQVHLQDVLNDALKKEIHHLKMLTGQNLTNGGPMVNFPPLFGPNPRFHPNNQAVHAMLTAQQLQQLQIQSRNQQQQHHHYYLFQQPQLPFQHPQQLHQFQQQQQQHHP